MTGLGSRLVDAARIILTAAMLLSVMGVSAWLTMPRQEDPPLSRRFGMISAEFPGADAEAVERLVLDPIEERLAEVAQIRRTKSWARAGFATITIELRDDTHDFDEAWRDIENAVGKARPELPQGVMPPLVDKDAVDQDAVVLAITGSSDPLALAGAARRVKRQLLALSSVASASLVADPGEQITIEYEDAMASRLGLDARTLAAALAARNVTPAGGSVRVGTQSANLRPATEFRSVEELERTPILLPGGSTVPLGDIAQVRHGPADPVPEAMRFNGAPAVGLGLVAREQIDLVRFGALVRAELEQLRNEIAPLQIHEVAFAPDHVEARIDELGRSLLLGVAIVAVVLFAAMGVRLGLAVATVVPLVTFSSLALFAAGGGLLHQISIAALVIALGMVVDNAIVVAENMQSRLDLGMDRRSAVAAVVRELLVPLGTATGTTLAAFVPMLLARGATADFTRTIPVIVMLTLAMSYVYAITVTPLLCAWLLRAAPSGAASPFETWAGRLGAFASHRPKLVLFAALLAVGGALGAARLVDQQFFPVSDRATVMVELALPEGSHMAETDRFARQLENMILEQPNVVSVSSFIGRSAPRFYYNLQRRPHSPHLAQLVVETTDPAARDALVATVREQARTALVGVEVVARRLEQGPAVVAPIEVRLLGDDLAALRNATELVSAALRAVPGAIDVRHDLSLGSPTVRFEIHDAAAARHGLSRADVAQALLGRTRGLAVGQYRAGDDPVPIYVRHPDGENTSVEALATTTIPAPGQRPTSLAAVASMQAEWHPAVIAHRDRRRTASVFAQVGPGSTPSAVVEELKDHLREVALPEGVSIVHGGEAEGTAEANAALSSTIPLGVLLLISLLMAEFNSFRRVGIILVTAPLALTGVIPGLILGDQPFGFMSLLGVIALVGVVVNNAIILLDVVEQRRRERVDLLTALADAVRLRTRPILLTTGTTVAGLLPLAFTQAALWPPLAWAMITGLLASTALTLLVVPALYRLSFPTNRLSPNPPEKTS